MRARGLILLAAAVGSLQGQSLDPRNPARLQRGVNASNIDAFMKPHYWTFVAEKGNVKINLTFRAQSILGAALRTQVAFSIYDTKTPDKNYTKVLESTGQEVSAVVEGPSETEHRMVIEVIPPNAVVRAGGDYQIEAVAGVKFLSGEAAGAGATGADPIVTRHFRTYGCQNDAQCGIRFLEGGVVTLPGGEKGTWRLFDRERGVYVIVIGNQRQSLKLKPGVGLVQVQDDRMVVYQEVR
jgi:hypothetical protein